MVSTFDLIVRAVVQGFTGSVFLCDGRFEHFHGLNEPLSAAEPKIQPPESGVRPLTPFGIASLLAAVVNRCPTLPESGRNKTSSNLSINSKVFGVEGKPSRRRIEDGISLPWTVNQYRHPYRVILPLSDNPASMRLHPQRSNSPEKRPYIPPNDCPGSILNT